MCQGDDAARTGRDTQAACASLGADALMCESYARLLGDERAQMVFADPPWNIPIAGHVSGQVCSLSPTR
jgi:hypothetical protein